MLSNIYWIDHPGAGPLAIMARPRGGEWLDDEVENWRAAGVQVVVSLLEPDEELELGLATEADACLSRNIEFIRFPVADRGVPHDRDAALGLARMLSSSGRATAIHCRAGIGRAALMAALVLIQSGVTPDSALELIQTARGAPVPDTDQQREWIKKVVR
jgi:protein-tyrosine phosphatase